MPGCAPGVATGGVSLAAGGAPAGAVVVCAVLDFLWSYFRQHSIGSGLVAVILGLFGTAWYLFLSGAWKSDK